MKVAIKGMVVAAALSCCMLAGCMAPQATNAVSEEVKANRAYMSAVHKVVNSIQDQTALLSGAVEKGDYAQAAQIAGAVDAAVKGLDSLDVPNDLKDVHHGYVEGCTKLSTALTDYVGYRSAVASSDQSSSSDVASAMASMKLSTIQTAYDAGVLALSQADALAASL